MMEKEGGEESRRVYSSESPGHGQIPESDSRLKIFLSWLGFLLVMMPVAVLIFLPLKIWKTLVVCYVKIFLSESTGDCLTGYDSIFAIDKFYEKPYAGNVTLFVVEGNVGLNTLRNGFIQNILTLEKTKGGGKGEPQFEKLFQAPALVAGYFFWRRMSIDIHAQIRHAHKFSSDDHDGELNQVIGQLMTSPFPKGCPLWELLLYSGYNGTESVVVFRLHHTLGDGYSFNHLVDHIINKKSPYMVKNERKGLRKKAELLLTTPPKLCKLYSEGFTHKDYYTQTKKNTTGLVSMTSIPLETMKSIRRATKTHFATVGMSVLCGALKRYFLENEAEDKLPPYVSIMHSLPKPNHPLTRMVNHWGVGIFKIPMKSQNALERLLEAEQNFGSYMDDQYNELIQCHVPLFNLLPEPLIRMFFKTQFGTSMGFTSVPAYEGQANLFGNPNARILRMGKVFGMQWAQTAVAAAVYTHNGQVSFSLFVNKDIVGEQEGVDRVTKEYLAAELQDLLRLCNLQPQQSPEMTITTTKISTTKTKLSLHRLERTEEGFA